MKNEWTDVFKYVKQYGRIQAIMRYVDKKTLKESYKRVMQKGGEGIGAEYGKKLDENLDNLLMRMKKFSYFPQPKNHVTSNGNQNRKYAVRAFEDEIVQEVFRKLLEVIYKALDEREQPCSENQMKQVNCLGKLFLKIKSKEFSGSVNEKKLIEFLKQDIADKNFIKYIKRFLDSGILYSEKKSVQCESLSEVLIGIYIYYTVNSFVMSICHELEGKMCMWKNKDDFCYFFENSEDAKTTYRLLHKYLNELGIVSKENDFCKLTSYLDFSNEYARRALERMIKTHSIRCMREYGLQNKHKNKYPVRKIKRLAVAENPNKI